MRFTFSIIIILFFIFSSFGQDRFIQIETNKVLNLFNFLETSSGQLGTSSSFRTSILSTHQQDTTFHKLIKSYSNLNLEYNFKRQELPQKRISITTTKDLLWIAASNSKNLTDFNQRIIGVLPHQTQIKFIEILKKSEDYYIKLIGNNEQKNILRIHNQLSKYTNQISNLYLKISNFYNTTWSSTIPFKIMLYPIPLKSGNTTAIPKGNLLISGFLSHKENDYKSQLGIIIHEMCHILYKEQAPKFQHQIEEWFKNSDSPYAPLAYSFFDEGLATALGNGWAYKQIHNELDTREWYNNKHIDGFAHALFPLIKHYLEVNKSIDQKFIEKSIQLFKQTFPKAITETEILMNSLQLYTNTEKEIEIDDIFNNIHHYFNIRSMRLASPILSLESKKTFKIPEITKLYIINSDNKKTIKGLQKSFPNLKIKAPINTINIFKDSKTNSTLIIMNLNGITKLKNAYKTLSTILYLENGMSYKIK